VWCAPPLKGALKNWRGTTKYFPALCAGYVPPLFVPVPLPTIDGWTTLGYYSYSVRNLNWKLLWPSCMKVKYMLPQ